MIISLSSLCSPQYAVKLVTEGGARRLLALSIGSNFQGFLNLATLIFRHILEEPVALRYCMEKVSGCGHFDVTDCLKLVLYYSILKNTV